MAQRGASISNIGYLYGKTGFYSVMADILGDVIAIKNIILLLVVY